MSFKKSFLKILSALPFAGLSFMANQALAEDSASNVSADAVASNVNVVASSSSTGSGTEDFLTIISTVLSEIGVETTTSEEELDKFRSENNR